MSDKTDMWMPVYLGDYLGDTQRLTTEQHGAYLLLLFDYWRNGPPPADDAVLSQITRLSRPAWKKMKPTILAYFEESDGKLIHGRVERELEKAQDNQERRTERAKKAAEARWSGASKDAPSNARRNASSKRQAMHNECPIPSPSSKAAVIRARKFPDDWTPEPFGKGSEASSIIASWPSGEFERQFERFRDHHRAKGSKFEDWQAAWGTWVRNSVEFSRPRRSDPTSPPRFIDTVREELERERRAASGSA